MTFRLFLVSCLLLTSGAGASPTQLWVDFNSTTLGGGPHPETGYESYDAGHEVAADFVAQRNYSAFGTNVSLTVDFPDTGDQRVQQMIDRDSGNDLNWQGDKRDLLTDWIGVDTRTGFGGNGDYDGTTGSPSRIVFTLEGIPAGDYHWRSYHHDTENVVGRFRVEVSTDGGGSFVRIAGPESGGDFRMTDSTPGGIPAGPLEYTGTEAGSSDPATLPSTLDFDFTASAGLDVVLRFIPLPADATHAQLFGVNGFEIDLLAPLGAPTDLALSNTILSRTVPVGTVVGTLATTDPTPADQFTYTLVAGTGDVHNGDFDINGDQLVVDHDLTVHPTGTQLRVRVRTTDLELQAFEKAFTIVLVNDADGDGLDDDWELTWFPDLATADGDGDADADLLTNLQEQATGTNPTLADTDGDGLRDDVENGSGTFNGPADPGSSPLLADTDGDGLSDWVEVSAANGHITNPNLADTDRDGFSDPVELSEGTDPNNSADFPDTLLPLVLSEIMTRNETGLEDGFGTREDWIEIHNPNPQPVHLDSYFLTDNAAQPMMWSFPEVTIPADGYLIVFASGVNQVDPLGHPHTNFKLESVGEYLAIIRPDGSTVDDAFSPAFPEQFADLSHGPRAGDGAPAFFDLPTPGAANGTGFPGVVKDTNFDIGRGFFASPIAVAITSATPDATIRYTTDGSRPSVTHGTIYSTGIPVATTTTLRAIAYKAGWLSTNVDTQTYVFVDDVARQPANPPGWPADWSNSGDPDAIHPADYEMDPRVVNNTLPGYSVQEALLDIPTVSLAMEPADFLNSEAEPATGMYSNPASRFERPCSIEYVLPDGTPGFQYDAKVEVHGNASRRPARMHKHSLRVTFTTEFGGPGKLRYPLFPDSPVDQFNKLVLRACFTDSWGLVSWGNTRYRPNDSQYFRDVWMKESFGAMGQPTSYGNFVHLYVNGLYFGVHNLTERLEDDFYAEHFGGAPEDWHVNADFSSPDARWNTMLGIDVSNPAGYSQVQDYVDLANYADYMLLHFYADAEDWPTKNGYAAANTVSGDGRYRFNVWDQEIMLDYHGRAASRIDRSGGGGALFQKLRANEEFRLFFADRVRKHCFDGGALSLGASQARYLDLAGRLDKAIVAESARWGDTQAKTPYGSAVEQPAPVTDFNHPHYPPALNYPSQADIYFTREDNWVVERDNVVNNYLPAIHDTANSYALINVLRAGNLYPLVEAPVFDLYGGVVAHGHELAMTSPLGTIYYTLDGSDPREPGGAVNPAAGSIATGVVTDTLLGFEESGWSWLATGTALSGSDLVAGHPGYGTTDWKHPSFAESGWSTNGRALLGGENPGDIGGGTINTIIDLGPDGARHSTTYFRKAFTVTGAADYATLEIGVKRDDGAVLYLNGREIARTNMPAGDIGFTTPPLGAAGGNDESAVHPSTRPLQPGDLVEGINVLAVEVHQAGAGSSDLAIDVQLVATKSISGGPATVVLTGTGTVKARTLSGGEWSARTEADFIVGTPASSADLVISEIMYNPVGMSEEAEYIELMNISDSAPIDLTGVAFDQGILYGFPVGLVLPPGGRVIVPNDPAAFAAAYGTVGITIAAGQYEGNLANGGEHLGLVAQDGLDIRRFRYGDAHPWPESADGLGFSLVLVAPGSNPDHALPENWRASVSLDGSPGGSDALPFTGDPDADEDQDGKSALLEHAVAHSDSDSSDGPVLVGGFTSIDGGGGPEDFLTISFDRNLAADDVTYTVEVSTDLDAWSPLDTILLSRVHHGDGTSTETYRSLFPTNARVRQFMRLKVALR